MIVNLSMRDTIEDLILGRLYERIEIFERSVGDLEAILGEEIHKLERELFSQKLTKEEEVRKIEQVARVLEVRKQELDQFESAAETLLGHDEFFVEEINQVRSRGRYIAGSELYIYLRDFLQAHYRSCTIKEQSTRSMYMLRVTQELTNFVRRAVPFNDLGLRLFLQRSSSGEVTFTIDSDIAQTNQRMEFLTFHHPLIRAITAYYDEHPTELHPVSYVQVASAMIPRGTYAWFLYVTEITGARPMKDLEVVAVSIDSNNSLSSDQCEDLLSSMIAEASSVPPAQRTTQVPDALCSRADEVLTLRLEERFRERQRSNDALVNNRLASIKESFERNQQKRSESIQKAQDLRRKESYIRGLETGLKNLERAYGEKVRDIESTRASGRSFLLRGAGVVEVRAS